MLTRLFGKTRPAPATAEGVSEITLFDEAAQEEFVDLETLCARLGLDLEDQPFRSDLKGTLERRPDGWTICVNASLGLHERRFTIANAIAHHLLNRDLIGKRDGAPRLTIGDGHRQLDGILHNPHILHSHELEANRMAFQLLMAESKMRRMTQEGLDAEQIGPLIGMPVRTVRVRLEGLKEKHA